MNIKKIIAIKFLAENGDLDAEMTHRIQSGWKNWKRISGILCDRRINVRVKEKVYKTVVRPAMMYGAETWAVKKAQEVGCGGNEDVKMDEWSYQRWTELGMK